MLGSIILWVVGTIGMITGLISKDPLLLIQGQLWMVLGFQSAPKERERWGRV